MYILASEPYGTLYVGVTVDLIRRVSQHKTGIVSGFTKEYGVKRLVWYEAHTDLMQAITREKRIKRWRRDWKVNLIQQMNADWHDLFDDIAGQVALGSPPARG